MKIVIVGSKSAVGVVTENLINEGRLIASVNIEGHSYEEMKEAILAQLEYDASTLDALSIEGDSHLVTADERMLMLHPELFEVDDYYLIDKDYKLVPLSETTNKELRPAHNLFNMYIAGAFHNYRDYNPI